MYESVLDKMLNLHITCDIIIILQITIRYKKRIYFLIAFKYNIIYILSFVRNENNILS